MASTIYSQERNISVGIKVDQNQGNLKGEADDVDTSGTGHTKPVLTSLLQSCSNYTPEQRAAHVQFLEDYVVPSMGQAPEKSRARSLLSPNGSPFEISLNNSDRDGVVEDPLPTIAEKVGADMRWFGQFAAEFFPSNEDEELLGMIMPKDTIRIPKVFLAFDLEEDKRTMKAYFYPIIKQLTSKDNSDRTTFDLIRRLDPLGSSFGPALDVIEGYEKLLYQEPPLTVVVGIDCINPEDGARIKIYIEPRSNTWATVRKHVTLGGKRMDKHTLDGLMILRDMWNLLIDEPEDKVVDENFSKAVPERT